MVPAIGVSLTLSLFFIFLYTLPLLLEKGELSVDRCAISCRSSAYCWLVELGNRDSLLSIKVVRWRLTLTRGWSRDCWQKIFPSSFPAAAATFSLAGLVVSRPYPVVPRFV